LYRCSFQSVRQSRSTTTLDDVRQRRSGKLPQWRCLKLANVRDTQARPGRWYEGGSHKATQKCVTGIDLDINIDVRKLR
jgi:hypothetical protein